MQEKLYFPHDKLRETQSKFIADIMKSVNSKSKLIAHVPTGVGKTAAVLAPIITYALNKNLTVFFVTPRHTQHKIAIETVKEMNKKYALDILAVDLIGKQSMCPVGKAGRIPPSQFNDYCKEAREEDYCKYYSNYKNPRKKFQNQQLIYSLIKKGALHCQDIVNSSRSKELCPYEVSCELSKNAKVIVADYFHVINESIRKNLFKKTEKYLENSIIIFDEAHNLPKRCKGILTHSLTTRTIDLAISEAKKFNYEDLPEKLELLKETFLEISQKINSKENESFIQMKDLKDKIPDYEQLINQTEIASEIILQKKEKSYISGISKFLKYWIEEWEEGFVRIIKRIFSKDKKPIIRIDYICLDPSVVMHSLKDAHSIICMSGTLTPTLMYKDLLGFEDAQEVQYKNPFPEKNVLRLVIPKVTTKFSQRTPEMYQQISNRCAEIVNTLPGNSFVFFPSYDMRDKIYSLCNPLVKKTTFLEISGMSKSERDEMIEKFKTYKEKGACLFGVSGGSFAEGVDLPGDYLKAVVVVGIPLARPDLETNAVIDYYDKKFGKGWDYGYIYPAILTSIQSAGRCIRSESDRGVVVFMDERYTWPKYKKCFPEEMDLKQTSRPEVLINNFFQN